MDIGTAAYTEFDMSPDVISYMTNNPELLDCQMGLIHSHNQMATFFSGTDISTLKEEGIDRNHFVSLIVNNAGTYTAAITRKVTSQKVGKNNFSYPTFDDKIINSSTDYLVETEELEYYYLNIEFENKDNYQDDLNSRLSEIRKAKAENSTKFKVAQPPIQCIQGNLFSKTNNTNNNIVKPKEYEDIEDLSFQNLKVNKDTIKSLVLQLVTGSIIVPNESKIDIYKWAKGMTPLYEKRFGHGEVGLTLFETWATFYIEYLCYYTEDEAFWDNGLNEDESSSLIARDLIIELKKLPYNKYIGKYISILQSYII